MILPKSFDLKLCLKSAPLENERKQNESCSYRRRRHPLGINMTGLHF
jgi:hypothetical protein